MVALKYIILLSACAAVALAYSNGAPSAACVDLTPQHNTKSQITPPPYTIALKAPTIESGKAMTVTLSSNSADVKLMGFLLQARDGETTLGSFKVTDQDHTQTLTCKGTDDSITHKRLIPNGVSSVQFDWIAPADFKGNVQIVGTALKNGAIFWNTMKSESLSVV